MRQLLYVLILIFVLSCSKDSSNNSEQSFRDWIESNLFYQSAPSDYVATEDVNDIAPDSTRHRLISFSFNSECFANLEDFYDTPGNGYCKFLRNPNQCYWSGEILEFTPNKILIGNPIQSDIGFGNIYIERRDDSVFLVTTTGVTLDVLEKIEQNQWEGQRSNLQCRS